MTLYGRVPRSTHSIPEPPNGSGVLRGKSVRSHLGLEVPADNLQPSPQAARSVPSLRNGRDRPEHEGRRRHGPSPHARA